MNEGYYNQYFNPNHQQFSLIIEDDEKVAYAYLLEQNEIVGDVWLYNHLATPDQAEWHTKENMPFLNPKEYVETNLDPITHNDDIQVKWESEEVYIYIRNKLVAFLKKGSNPGWSKMVKKDGPLASKF